MASQKKYFPIRGIQNFSIIILWIFFSFSAFSQEMLWGLTSEGGEFGAGTIFKTAADGTNLKVQKSLQVIAGANPAYNKLIQSANGKLYGMTTDGGGYLKGVLFEYNLVDNSYIVKHNFDGESTGSHPYGSLVEGVNGKLYGLTSTGGIYNKGVIFEYDLGTGTCIKKFDFVGLAGETPYGDLISIGDGKLYGVTYSGGNNDYGVLFQYDPVDDLYTKKKDFSGSIGVNPFGGLIQASSGRLYGMANGGGAYSKGTIFEYDYEADVITKRFDFSGINSGEFPTGSLLQANNGLFYGMTTAGGNNGKGVLFQFNFIDGEYVKKIDFDGNSKGQAPYGSLMQASNGKIYGTTEQGIAGYGGLFEFDISDDAFNNIVTFDGNSKGNGASSRNTMIQASDGQLYGMTSLGGVSGNGVLFSYDPDNKNYQVKLSFSEGEEGNWPLGSLVQGINGKLYGMTYNGGEFNGGILFEYNISQGVFIKKLDFSQELGTNPSSGMLRASNGKLYGVTRFGGLGNSGVLFEYDPTNNIYINKESFYLEMGKPIGSLIQIPNGKMYGVTDGDGIVNHGVLFEYDPENNMITKKVEFDGVSTGSMPSGSLLFYGEKIYGLTQKGGVNDKGVLFEFDQATSMLTNLKNFDGGAYGANPVGSLVKSMDNKLYGVTQQGGNFNWGTIFEYDPMSDNLVKKFSFSGNLNDGLDIQGGMVESSNGSFYGIMNQGGNDNKGVLFEYTISTNTYTKKQDFTGSNGARPYFGPLLFISMQEQLITFDSLEEKKYGDSEFDLSASTTSGLEIIFTSSNTNVASIDGNVITIHNVGTTIITATQLGGINFHPSTALRTLVVNKSDQIITFEAIPDKTNRDQPFLLNASADSGLPISYTSSNPSIAKISGNLLTITGIGTVDILASQTGNNNYNPALDVKQTFTVNMVLSADNRLFLYKDPYPNPANHEFYFELENNVDLDLKNLFVYDELGNFSIIDIEKFGERNYRCYTGGLPEGIYFITIPGNNFRKKIIIEH